MKTVRGTMFLKFLIAMFTVFHVTADLIEVKKQSCVSKITNFFKKCESNTVEDHVNFVFYNAVPNEMTSSQNKILREYTEHIYKTVELTGYYRSPNAFCESFWRNSYSGDTPDNCRNMLQQNAKELFESLYGDIITIIYKNYSIRDDRGMHVEAYMNDVRQFFEVREIRLEGLNTVELFCSFKECEYQLQIDIPNISTDETFHGCGRLVFLNTDIERIPDHHHYSINYINYVYGGINETKAISNLNTPKDFCKDHYKQHKKICADTINSYLTNEITNKVSNTAESKKEFLKHMFFHLTSDNTKYVQIKKETINFTFQYMQKCSEALIFDSEKVINFRIQNYCRKNVLNKLLS